MAAKLALMNAENLPVQPVFPVPTGHTGPVVPLVMPVMPLSIGSPMAIQPLAPVPVALAMGGL